MVLLKTTFGIVTLSLALIGCSGDNASSGLPQTQLSMLQTEFMKSCRARPEYISKRRAGTLDKHCTCVFKTTMRGLSEDEQRTAALYLYGESNDGFRKRYQENPPNLDAMPGAVNAVAKAAQRCR